MDLEIHTKSSEIWKAMYADCAQAKKSIELEQYILKDDKAGHRFLKLFTEKVKAGLDVRLMLDSIGSRDLLLSSAFSEFKQAGGIAHFYNPINLGNIFLPKKWLPRDHIKTLLIDGKVCYIGSACIWEDTSTWHDLQARFTGALVQDVKGDFLSLWAAAGKNKIPFMHKAHAHRKYAYITSSQFGMQPNRIYQEILQAVSRAKKNVCIVTPYFLPPWRLRRALRHAVKRGVDVRVMVSERSDVDIADYVSRSYYPKLIRFGIHILHYQKTILHAKYIIIDDDWATIGSTNMDYLSLFQNREANIFITDKEAVAKVQLDFDSAIKNCQEVSINYYRTRPWWEKLLGYLGRSMRRIL